MSQIGRGRHLAAIAWFIFALVGGGFTIRRAQSALCLNLGAVQFVRAMGLYVAADGEMDSINLDKIAMSLSCAMSTYENPRALEYLAKTMFLQGRGSQAAEYWKQLMDVTDEQFTSLIWLNAIGNTLLDQSRYGEAEETYRYALDLKPETQKFWIYWGFARASYFQRKTVQAEEHFLKAANLSPTDVDKARCLYWVGRILYEDGDVSAAVPWFEQAVRLDSNDKWMHFALADAYRDLGMRLLARAEYQRVLEIDPLLDAAKTEVEKLH